MANHKPNKVAMQYFAIIVALVFVGQFTGFFASYSTVGTEVVSQMASVIGMSVGVPPNEVNLLAQSLEQRATELTEREKAIDARERGVRAIVAEENAKSSKFMLRIIVGVTSLLVLLIVLNFYLDRRRSRENEHESAARGVPILHTKKTGPHAHEGEYQTRL